MGYQVKIDSTLLPLLRHLPPLLKKAVKESLRFISKNPTAGKALVKNLAGFQSYRVKNFRIIYTVVQSRKLIKVIFFGPRKTVYEELEKELLK